MIVVVFMTAFLFQRKSEDANDFALIWLPLYVATTCPFDGKCWTDTLVYKAIVNDHISSFYRTVNRKAAQDSKNMFGIEKRKQIFEIKWSV